MWRTNVIVLITVVVVISSAATISTNNTQTVLTNKSVDVAKNNNISVVSEGGTFSQSSTHEGREHVVVNDPAIQVKAENIIEKPSTNVTNTTKASQITTKIVEAKPANSSVVVKPVVELPKDDNKTSVPKKGVDEKLMSSSTTTTRKPMKPKITESDDISPNEENKEEDLPKPSVNKNVKRSDYVVPIVAVILSVPLVAVLISLIYKKGADWWQHRNYRRMDYLIEGIYNN